MNAKEFYGKLGFEPYKHQKEAFEKINFLADHGGVVIIKAPTASGKTESAVAPYFAGVYDKSYSFAKLIYVLPARALADAQRDRLEEIANKLRLKLKIVTDHGNAYDKPMLNGDVVVCTLDTFIYGYASLRTFGYRLHYPTSSIATSLVIFDEIQMFQDEEYYTPRIIARIFKYLYKSNIPFVVMTATLPEKLENMLFKENNIPINEDNIITCDKARRGNVKVKYSPSILMKSLDEFIDEIKNSRKVGIILNTVPKAQKVYEKLKEVLKDDKKVILLHSRIKSGEREGREKSLRKLDEFIVVATQVIEAGLDISLNFMLTELAPADALIQRIGRVARRENEIGRAVIFEVNNQVEPYPNNLIENTRKIIDNIGNCLNDLNKIQKVVNEVYKGIEISEHSLLIQADLYFDELRLFSLPPEYELRVRPELYVTLFVPPHDSIDKITEEAKIDWSKKSHLGDLGFNIKDNSFNVSVSWIRQKLENQKDLLLKVNNKYVCLDGRFDGDRRQKIFGFSTCSWIEPYRIYVLNPKFYSEDYGLKVS